MTTLNQEVTVKNRKYNVVAIADNSNRPNLQKEMDKSGFIQSITLKGKKGAYKMAFVTKSGSIEIC